MLIDHFMKKNLLMMSLACLGSFKASTQDVTLDAESGNWDQYVAQCWTAAGVGVSHHGSALISGKYSLRTNELDNTSPTASWVKTPWMGFSRGYITFQTKLNGESGGSREIVVHYIPLEESQGNALEGKPVEFYRYEFDTPVNKNTTVNNVSIPVPHQLVDGKFYKLLFSFVGTGGSARAALDNLVIPAIYSSDPSKNCSPLVPITDKDGDGVADSEDAYPNDAFKSFDNYFPARGFATLMFEDLWPGMGDYDFNDLVVDYRINRITDSKNEVVEAHIELNTRAIGAGFKNGFGIEFTGIAPGKVLAISGTKIGARSVHHFADNGLEAETKWLTLIAYDNALQVLPYPGGGVTGVNTETAAPRQKVETQVIILTFKNDGKASANGAVHVKELGPDNFNPFLVQNQNREIEIHLPGKPPTALADQGLFGTIDDNSSVSNGVFYQSKDSNLPWALHVNQSIPYMIEKEGFSSGYFKFKEWVISNGSAYKDWYMDLPGYRENKLIF
jgi:LruC domain-containing protein